MIILAGLPATTVKGGTDLVTTAPAAMTAPSPIIVALPKIIALVPIQARFFIILERYSIGCFLNQRSLFSKV